MKLYKITTSEFGYKPNLDSIIDIFDMCLNKVSLEEIRQWIKNHNSNLPRSLNSNDKYAIVEKGRTILYRNNDNITHWIIDFDHPDYLPLKRNSKLDIILENIQL
jgi:hypothetical protein